MNKHIILARIIRFGDETPEEKKAREEKEAAAKAPKYSEAEFNALSAKQRENHERATKRLEEQLTKTSTDARVTQEERDKAQKELEELQTQYKSAKQIEEERVANMKKAHNEELAKEKEEAKKWRNSYSDLSISHALSTEAAKADVLIPGQIEKLLRPDTSLVEEINDEGKSTGRLVVRVKLETTDKDDKPVTLVLPVSEAIKTMKEKPEQYGNLFKGSGQGGIGSNTTKGGKDAGFIEDTDAFMADRAAKRKAANA